MTILVTNDDGIAAEGLWSLVRELRSLAPLLVVAPESEQSAVGTAVSLYQPLEARRVKTEYPGVDAYSVAGTPSDCVIIGLSMLAGDKIDMVVSGINHGPNLGDDVLISGTVSAALQGYLHGHHALAVSMARWEGGCLDTAARMAALLSRWVGANSLPGCVFLNVNVPDLPPDRVKEVLITRLARGTHTDAAEERDGKEGKFYWLVRYKRGSVTDNRTDVWAVEQGNISVTPLHAGLLNQPVPAIPDNLPGDLLRGLLDYPARDKEKGGGEIAGD